MLNVRITKVSNWWNIVKKWYPVLLKQVPMPVLLTMELNRLYVNLNNYNSKFIFISIFFYNNLLQLHQKDVFKQWVVWFWMYNVRNKGHMYLMVAMWKQHFTVLLQFTKSHVQVFLKYVQKIKQRISWAKIVVRVTPI